MDNVADSANGNSIPFDSWTACVTPCVASLSVEEFLLPQADNDVTIVAAATIATNF
jgi:hypothetical protein